jgi:hypothetical protein
MRAAFAVLFFTAACSYFPIEGSKVDEHGKIEFEGYAIEPGGTIRMQAFNWGANEWQTIGSATAWDQPNPGFSTNLYYWSAKPAVPSWAFNVGNLARVKAEEQVNGWEPMSMYTQAGFNCLLDKYGAENSDGDTEKFDAQNAGIDCSTRHEVFIGRGP